MKEIVTVYLFVPSRERLSLEKLFFFPCSISYSFNLSLQRLFPQTASITDNAVNERRKCTKNKTEIFFVF